MDKISPGMNKMVKRWELWLAAIIPPLIVGIILMSFKNSHEDTKIINEKIEKKYDKVEALEYIDKQDGSLMKTIDDYKVQNKIFMDGQTQYLKSIDEKLNILIQRNR